MKLYMPTYCKSFKCTADKCSDNCCVGWEIDIDSDTLAFYGGVTGEFGKRLKENIETGDTSFFRLKNERCPFLNKNNLCDIISTLGEEHLCQICRDHPRYFNWYEDFMEGGIGLCCEEGARLILTGKGFEVYFTERNDLPGEEYDKDLMKLLKEVRQKLISLFTDSEGSLCDSLAAALAYAKTTEKELYYPDLQDLPCVSDPSQTLTELFSLLKELEPISDSWSSLSKELFEGRDYFKKFFHAFEGDERISSYLKNIAVYFIWRYFLPCVYTGEVYAPIFLMAVSVLGISAAMGLHLLKCGELSQQKAIDIAKDFSKQIEYSEDNLSMIFDCAFENEKLSFSAFTELLR